MKQNNKQINKQIAARYGKYAQQVMNSELPLNSNVDGQAPHTDQPASILAGRLYGKNDLIDLPEPVVNAALGCGNPVALANIKLGEYVLDLGSGGGIDCFLAAKAVGPKGKVIGVDATPQMIKLANKNREKIGATNVEFLLGKIEDLPLQDNMIDLIISNCVIDVSPDKTAVFHEAFRVLKSSGRMAITDTIIMGDIPPNLKANIDIWAGAVITPLITINEFLRFIADAGFVNIHVDSLTTYGLESFDRLDLESKKTLTKGVNWAPLPPNTGLYSAAITARKP